MRGHKLRRSASRLLTAIGRRLRPDGASFLGAIVCMISLCFPWVLRDLGWLRSIAPPAGATEWPEFIQGIKSEWWFVDLVLDPAFTAVMIVFLAGIVLSLFHRGGVILQAAGILGFAFAAHSHFITTTVSTVFNPADNEYLFGPGYFIAILGVFISMFAAKNFWWQRESRSVVPSISRVTALSPNSTRASGKTPDFPMD